MACSRLPPEILAEIASYFQECSQLPNENRSSERTGRLCSNDSRCPRNTGCHYANTTDAYYNDIFQLLHTPHPEPIRTQELQAMMLVNHEWHDAAIPELYKVTRLPILQTRTDESGRKEYRGGWEWLLSSDTKAEPSITQWRHETAKRAMRHVVFSFSDDSPTPNNLSDADGLESQHIHRSEPFQLHSGSPIPDSPSQEEIEALEAGLTSFPTAIKTLPTRLSTLEVRLPPWSDELQGDILIKPESTRTRLQAIVTAVSSVLAVPTALPYLTDLRLMFTGTKDFADLARDVPDSAPVWNRLQRLLLVITDENGEKEEIGDEHAQRNDPTRPNYQSEWPNADYRNRLWEIVVRCKNLKSLGIEATHALDPEVSDLDWIEVVAGTLEVLFLSHVKISKESLTRLIRGSEQVGSQLRMIYLKELFLKAPARSWQDIFQELNQCSSLRYCGLESLYSQGFSRTSRYQRLCSCLNRE